MNSCKNSQTMPYGRGTCPGEKPAMNRMDRPLGMTYVPVQKWRDLYQPEEAFQYGTIFKELNLPFTGRRMC